MAVQLDSVPLSREKPSPPEILLIPWDPDSSEHAERLWLQRIACGWERDAVEQWKTLQREGRKNIFWITLPPTSSLIPALIPTHLKAYPHEALPLQDTSTHLFALPRTTLIHPHLFHPLGHISLEVTIPDLSPSDPAQNLYCVRSLYISRALHSGGLGGAAMDALEAIATQEPFKAKELAVTSLIRESQLDETLCRAFGNAVPKFANQDWYASRGFVVCPDRQELIISTDLAGKVWNLKQVLMLKKL